MVYIYIFYSPQAQVYSEIVYIFCLHLKLWKGLKILQNHRMIVKSSTNFKLSFEALVSSRLVGVPSPQGTEDKLTHL